MLKIYTLADPRDGIIRYIGITKLTLVTRLGAHIRKARLGEKSHRASWIRLLDSEDIRPVISLLEETEDYEREVFWIRFLRQSGYDLVNTTDGGDGCRGLPEESRRRIGEASRRREVTPEIRAKISAAITGRQVSEATREKLRQANVGRPGVSWTDEQKAKSRQTKLGHDVSEETRAKISAKLGGVKRPNRKKAQCLNGHEYTEDNTFINIRGAQECRTCLSHRYRLRRLKVKLNSENSSS